MNPMILRRREVLRLTGLPSTTLWRRVRDGHFPEPIRLGGPNTRAVGWRRSDIEAWLERLESAAS